MRSLRGLDETHRLISMCLFTDELDELERHRCERCGGDGFIEYNDGDGSDWGEDCPSEENHLIICRACNGTGDAQ